MTLTVGKKIGLVFGIALLILIAVGTTSYLSTVSLVEAAQLRQRSYKALQNLAALASALNDIESSQRGYIVTGEDRYLEPYNNAVPAIDDHLQQANLLLTKSSTQESRIAALRPLINTRIAILQSGITARRNSGFEAARTLVVEGTGKREMDEINRLLREIETEENLYLDKREEDTNNRARKATIATVAGSLIVFCFMCIAGVSLSRGIANPLNQLTSVAQKIAAGELNVSLPSLKQNDEVGVLAASFVHMTDSLRSMSDTATRIAAGDLRAEVKPQSDRDVLGTSFQLMAQNLRRLTSELSEGISVLSASASQIFTSTNEFASTATETATAVTETTTTVEEVRQTAEVSSQKAKAVSDAAQRAVQVSQQGKNATEAAFEGMNLIRKQMDAIAESMVRLSEQSQAIAQILTTVEDLAAQSNLLAVNASIEAAKAGEHGRGFGVVAQEVKNLAEQSKQATGQVRTILNDIQRATTSAVMATEQGGKLVDAGVKQSGQAGQAIQALTGSVTEAAQAAAQIAASSQQQLVGVDQVAQAMESIKQASVQNVDSAKQLESAAGNLSSLGEKLNQIAKRYQV